MMWPSYQERLDNGDCEYLPCIPNLPYYTRTLLTFAGFPTTLQYTFEPSGNYVEKTYLDGARYWKN